MDSESQRQLEMLRQHRAAIERQREAAAYATQLKNSMTSRGPSRTLERDASSLPVATRLGRTVEVAGAEQQRRRKQREAAAGREASNSTFREQMSRLSKDATSWAERTEALGAGITAALSDQRAATAEWARRCSELASVRNEVAEARSELDAQERKLAAAALEVDTALQPDAPVPWLQPSPEVVPGSRSTAAIVCTLRAAPHSCVRTFITHHLDLGFSHIYLFFDDATDPAIDVARAVRKDDLAS